MFRAALTTARFAPRFVRAAPIAPAFTRLYASLPKADIEKRIVDVVKNFDKIDASKTVTPETSFVTDLGLDSLDTVEVLVAIEEEFDIEIDDKSADEIKTVGQAIDYIANNPDAN